MVLRALVLTLLIAATAAARAAVPVVYADDHIEIGAAVTQAGAQPMHLGDELTLVVEARFDSDAVQVESLDADWFRRAFAALGAVSLRAADELRTTPNGGGAVRLAQRWHFQILGCPPGRAHCPGAKRYELPLASIAYRLSAGGEDAVAERSARFTPWPGRIDLVPAIRFEPAAEAAIDDVIPGGAWPAPGSGTYPAVAGTVMTAAGGLLLASGLIAGRRRRPAASPGRYAPRDSRWERAAERLSDPSLDAAAWSDLLRRCITWYCQDELGRNPVEWLRTAEAPDDPRMAECRSLYLDVLAETGIAADRRETFRARWAQVTGGGPRAGDGRVPR